MNVAPIPPLDELQPAKKPVAPERAERSRGVEPQERRGFRRALERRETTQDLTDNGNNEAQGLPVVAPILPPPQIAPRPDITTAAVKELTSKGQVKATQARAQAVQRDPGSREAADPEVAGPGPAVRTRDHADGPERQAPAPAHPRNERLARLDGRNQEAPPGPPAPPPSHEAEHPAFKPSPNESALGHAVQVPFASPRAPETASAVRQAQAISAIPAKAAPAAAPRASLSSLSAQGLRGGDRALRPASSARATLRPDPGSFAAQLGRGLAAAFRQGGGTVTLRLQPEALGELRIKMALEPGKVGARFEVQNEQARELLGKTMDSLRSALEARGLTVDRLEVHVARGAESPAQQFGGAETGSGRTGEERAGSEHPGHGAGAQGMAGMPPEPAADAAEPVWTEPWMGDSVGGALRLDALA